MKKIFMLGILFCCSFLIAGCGCNKKENINKEKIDIETLSGKFFDNQKLDILEIQNFNIAIESGESFVSFDVKNNSTEPTYVEYIKVLLYDEDDSLIITTYGYIGKNIDGLETIHTEVDVNIDLSKASRVSYERM